MAFDHKVDPIQLNVGIKKSLALSMPTLELYEDL